VRGDSARAARSSLYRRLSSAYLLASMLRANRDVVGASAFLAGEVARDSLVATRAARALFSSIARDLPNSPLAPMAVLAAADLGPADSLPIYRARVAQDYPNTPSALILAGKDPSDLPAWRLIDEQLRGKWDGIVRAYQDSLTKLRPGAVAGQNPGQTPAQLP
jgi:hypothetical protein